MRNLAVYEGATDPDIAEQIVLSYMANRTPIYSLLMGRGRSRVTGDVAPKWKTGSLAGKRTQVNNGGTPYDETTTNPVVDDGSLFSAGHLVLCEATGEVVYVTSRSGNTLTVVRGVGSSVPAAAGSFANDAYLSIISRASGEGSGSPPESAAGATEKSNYCQIFRKRIGVSGSLQRSNQKTENELLRQRNAAMVEQVDELEQTIVHGVKSNDGTDADGNTVRTMGGIREGVVTNVTSSIGAMSVSDFWDAVGPSFSYGSGEKILAAGPTLLTIINSLFYNQIRLASPEGPVGIKVGRLMTPFGQLDMVPHNGLTGAYAGDGLIIDPGEVEIRPLEGEHSAEAGDFKTGRLHIVENTQAKGTDGRTDEIFAELTLAYGEERAHGQIKGATSADLGT